MADAGTHRLKYRAEIDGLRALAVVPVILFHAGAAGFSGGYVGVDIFFVISGYLITTILLNELEQDRFSLIGFYERRARRILPALFLVMLACLPFAWFMMHPSELVDFSQSLLATTGFSSNILFWLESGYFDTEAELKPLLHTWSLAVEEQFYIFFPLMLLFLWPMGRANLFALVSGLGLASLAFAHWGAYALPSATFYLLPTRAWELFAGALIAFYFKRRESQACPPALNGRAAEWLGLAGLGLIVASIALFDKQTPFPSLYALVPVAGTCLLIVYAQPGTITQRLLSQRVLVGIGLISYSGYLWHQPILAFYRFNKFGHLSAFEIIAVCALVAALAYLSWRFVEAPFRSKTRISRNTIFALSGLCMAAFGAIGLAGHVADGFPHRKVGIQALDYNPDNMQLRFDSWRLLNARSGSRGPQVEGNRFERTLWFNAQSPKRKLLIIGNSHSKDIYNILANSTQAQDAFEIARFGLQVRRALTEQTGLRTAPNYQQADIVMVATQYAPGDIAALGPLIDTIKADGKTVIVVTNIFEFQDFPRATLIDRQLRQMANVFDLERGGVSVSDQINAVYYDHYTQGLSNRPAVRDLNRAIMRIAAERGVPLLDRMDYVCDAAAKRCFALDVRYTKYFYDYGHHTLAGAAFFGARVDEIGWLSPLLQGGAQTDD